MIIKAYAKINWDLYITAVRPDGYHELDSLMQPIALFDQVTLSLSARDSLTVSGPYADGVPADAGNLALKAAKKYREAAGTAMSVAIHIEKNIPHGAGLGGGSADAAAVLKGMNALNHVPLSAGALDAAALSLGADVPFCLRENACIARGIGEKLTDFPLPQGLPLLLIMGHESLSTARIYQLSDALRQPFEPTLLPSTRSALQNGRPEAFSGARNMLFPAAVSLLPSLGESVEKLKAAGAAFAAMTGSGAALFGVFPDEKAASAAWKALKTQVPHCILTRTGTL